MAVFPQLFAGTAITWSSSGATKVITMTSKADGTAREGAKSATLVDGTNGFPELLEVHVETKVQAAPTDGKEIELYFGWSSSATAGTDNPGGLTGADADITGPDSVKLLLSYIMSIVLSNQIGTGLQRQSPILVRPADICFVPVLVNKSGQTISATGTDTLITVVPWYRKIV